MPSSTPALFTPTKVGDMTLQHRVVLAPLTRLRADENHVHSDLAVKYYSQRASTPGTLLISEATLIGDGAGASGYTNVPMLQTNEQLAALKKITDAVHAQGSFIFTQLWAIGRPGDTALLQKRGIPFAAPSNIPLLGHPSPEPLTIPQIKDLIALYGQAAYNAVHRAGYDGVEVHAANGYLGDQFISERTNNRTDEYGGSIEKRARYLLEAIESAVKMVGESKTAVRFSPWGEYHEMRSADPVPAFTYFVTQIKERFPNLAYISIVEPTSVYESNDFIRDIWSPRPIISANSYSRDKALAVAEQKGDLIAFGRDFLANPDLPLRLKANVPLNKPDPSTFYAVMSEKGYTDYPFAEGLDHIKAQ